MPQPAPQVEEQETRWRIGFGKTRATVALVVVAAAVVVEAKLG